MKNIYSMYINKSYIIFKGKKSTLIKSPYNDHQKKRAGVWITNKVIFPSDYRNQIRIGIFINQNYEIINYPIKKNSNLLLVVLGKELYDEFKIRKEKNTKDYFDSIKNKNEIDNNWENREKENEEDEEDFQNISHNLKW